MQVDPVQRLQFGLHKFHWSFDFNNIRNRVIYKDESWMMQMEYPSIYNGHTPVNWLNWVLKVLC